MPVVKGAFIFVCHQMYRTCEGLQMLIPYGLHESIAEAWRKVTLAFGLGKNLAMRRSACVIVVLMA